jgi:hypothetical protein
MEQIAEQKMECLPVKVREFHKEMMAEMKTNQERMEAKMDASQ